MIFESSLLNPSLLHKTQKLTTPHQSMCIANVLRDTAKEENGPELLEKDPLFIRARGDISTSLLSPPFLLGKTWSFNYRKSQF
jgi:hypothetical protein